MLNNLRQIYAYVKPVGSVPLQEEPFVLNKATNRSEKRLLMRSVKPIHAKIAELENYFYNSLFFTDKCYAEIYREGLEMYKDIYEHFRFKKGINMDEYYFVKLFKPLEDDK